MSGVDKTIALDRPGLSKSLFTTPCSRQGYYKETVRDESGRRLRFPMPERVTFGRAIDSAHSYIVEAERDGRHWSHTAAVEVGLVAAEGDADSWDLIEDHDTFAVQVANALTLFLEQPEGLAKMRERIGPSLRIQGDDGESLRLDDIVGTPDYLDDLGPIDVKTSSKTYTARKFHESPEMPTYALLWSAHNGGAVPAVLAYQVYVRLVKPKWQWIEVPGSADLIELGRLHANRWRKGIAAGDPDLFDANLAFCHDCPYAAAIPAVGFGGCDFGAHMPKEEAAA